MTADAPIRPRRSFLFAPGTAPAMYPKAMTAGADIMCIDLEDAVAPADKAAARQACLDWFDTRPDPGPVELLVRINGLRTPEGWADLLAILDRENPPPGLMLPKIKSPEEIRLLDELLTDAGSALRFQVIVETNEGLEAAAEIARASDRIDSLLFGAVDMSAELRVAPTWEALLYARQRLVHAAAGAGIDLIDVPFLDLQDPDGLAEAATRAAAIGMTGKGAIHPKQLPTIAAAFTPSAEEIAQARRIVDTFEAAGTGLVVVDGKLIEKPVLREMRRRLAIAAALG